MLIEQCKVAVIGLGQMGSRYTQRLLNAGFEVAVWNRTLEKTRSLAAAGAQVAPSAAAAAADTNIIVVALENASAFQSTLLAPDVLAQLGAEHLVIDMSTVHPSESRAACVVLSQRLAKYLDAPVSGGTRGAEQGNLTILVGGEAADFERARPILEVLGTPHLLGPTGAGQIAKLANQVIVAVTIGAVAEGLLLAERAGLDGSKLLSALRGGFADSRILREHGDRIIRRDFTPGATNRVFLKDLNAIQRLAVDLSTSLPLTARSGQAFADLIAAGHGESDHSSYFKYLEMINNSARPAS